MPKDYEVYKPNDENVAQIIVGILEEKGYNSCYQLGYPHNKIFIKVEDKEVAARISAILGKFMKKLNLTEKSTANSKVDTLTNRLGSLIPEIPNRKLENSVENIEKKAENIDVDHFEKSESEVYNKSKLEELRGKIAEKLDQINTLIAENPKDRSNEKRRIERDTLVWVLQNMPV